MVANIVQLTENANRLDNSFDILTINVNRFVETSSAEAAQDRQQAAIDRQELRNRVDQIINYLRDRNGGSNPPS
ncbi:hypothetical protein CAL7716_084180 [Calothrix sp. PCC 7716]|nr:hypothetical protein CAL7716_084180 [Calothrix sp. PCC 7716]